MKRLILLGLLTTSVTLISIFTNNEKVLAEKVLGKSELFVQQNNHENISLSSNLGSIETRNKLIIINSNKTYTIYNKKNQVVAFNITLEQLKKQNSPLHDIVRDSISGEVLIMKENISTDRYS